MNRITPTLFCLVTICGAVRASDPGVEFFEAKIRPVLVENCYPCHSAQAKKTKGGLLLDTREGCIKGGENGPAVVPGKPGESLLLKAIRREGDLKMPPKEPLPAAVVADIEKWISLGAPDPRTTKKAVSIDEARRRWAFQPLPAVHTTIDASVDAKLREKDLKRSPPADPHALVRRVYLDMLGVPPTGEEAAAFVADPSDAAYERLVDKLLADPRHGERWARHWLDVARFAESSGYEHDNDRPHAYTYRDFVIKAFNRDLPFDKFVRWQIAGDELAPHDPLAIAATGFLAAGLMNGQVTEREAEKERYEVLDDWTGTIGTAFLGLTIGCARCHDHKYDPIASNDYYRISAYFTRAVRANINVPRDPDAARRAIAAHNQLIGELTDKKRRYEDTKASRPAEAWRAGKPSPPAPPWLVLTASKASAGKTNQGFADHELTRQADGSYLFTRLNGDVGPISVVAKTTLEGIQYLRIEALTDDSLPNYGPGFGNNGEFRLNSVSLSIAPADKSAKPKNIKLEKTATTTGDKPGGASWAVAGKHAGRDQAAVFRLAEPVGNAVGTVLTVRMSCPGDSPAARQTIGKFRISIGTSDTDPSPIGPDMPHDLYVRGVHELESDHLTPAVTALYCLTDPEWQRLDLAVREAKRAWIRPAYDVVFGVTENVPPYRMMIQGPDVYDHTYLLQRGDPNKKGDIAQPAPLPLLARGSIDRWRQPPLPDVKTSNQRSALARWLTDSENGAGALVARVIVNRLWQHHFGRGIVGTPSDFGMQGDPPTHPELLNWLAGELISHNWSLKHIHKLILMSAIYRQASARRADALKADPEDALYWRYEPQRLEAEAIRDSMLAVSGRLDGQMFGPGTLDESSTRRSIYFTVKRSKLIPSLIALDWPEGLTGVGRRPTTTVAPQALWAINNPEVRKCAEALAGKLADLDDGAAVTRAYEITLLHPPTAAEASAALAYLQAGDHAARRVDFVHTLLITNEFVTLR